ncbi:MAG TPA: D-alanyl-D-alanine carboxypeptidase/D-alanyl-D-alanine-endopeptidase [Longimicrobiales bacterium]|nr:D-alanyl-D-alanine carboxypeptidase/D-alanyl-D-alanine-endopeptidase [Longimicrobiales bacterium]
MIALRAPIGRRAGAGALCALAAAGCATASTGGTGTHRSAIDAILDAPPLDQVHFGVLALDVRTGRTLYARNANRKFVPASNQKILVTSAALSRLGAEYRYETALWSTGPVRDGVLEGDLVLVGAGDPTLSDRYWESGEAALGALADSLVATGVRRVAGRLVVDVSAWDSASVGPTWTVENLRYAYGSTGGAFAIDHGQIRMIVRAGATVGEPAAVEWAPLGTDDFVLSRITTWPADSTRRVLPAYLPESRRLVVEGHVPAHAVDTLTFAIRDPVRQAAAALARALASRDVEFDGGDTISWVAGEVAGARCRTGAISSCPDAAPLAVLRSPPLSEIVEGILEPSQNWMTEQLVRTLGAERGEGGSWDAGTDVVTRFLVETVGVDSLDVVPRDGSGLSAYTLVTPRAIVRTLRFMADSPAGAAYRAAMAEPGEEDSTLERRLEGLEGRVYAKTGTISNVNSLSGYLSDRDGREIVFSILSNGSGLPSALVRAAIDDVVHVLAGQR